MISRLLHLFLLAVACELTAGSALANTLASTNYTLTATSVDVGGVRTTSSNYANGGSIGSIAGVSAVASPAETVKAGFEGQLYLEIGLTLDSPFVDNGTAQQLTATEVLDDGTMLVPPSSSLSWSLLSGQLPSGLALNSSTGVISGTPTGSHVYSFTILITDSLGNTAEQTFTPFETYAQWVSLYPQLSNSAPLATPQNDGVSNLLKYLFDIDPTQPMTAADRAATAGVSIDTTSTPGAQYLALTYRQNQALIGATVNLQTSLDLSGWTTVTPDLSHQVGTDSVTGDPIMEVGVLIVPQNSQQFIRLNVVNQ